MSLIVQKFGGSSVCDDAHLLRMARIVKSRVDEGDDVVVVLSAQGDTTDGLLQKAKEISGLGYSTTTLWRRSHDERLTSGTYIREAIRNGGDWQHLVPAPVAAYIAENNLAASL